MTLVWSYKEMDYAILAQWHNNWRYPYKISQIQTSLQQLGNREKCNLGISRKV